MGMVMFDGYAGTGWVKFARLVQAIAEQKNRDCGQVEYHMDEEEPVSLSDLRDVEHAHQFAEILRCLLFSASSTTHLMPFPSSAGL